MAETIILEVNVQQSIEQLAIITREINTLKEARTKLQKEAIKGDEDAAKAVEALNITIKQSTEDYKAQQRVVDGYVKAKKVEADTTNFANNSINTNRALLKQLTAQYNDLKNPSKEATDLIKRLSDSLKQQEAAIGDNRRSVGSYRESIVAAFKDIQVFGVNVGGIIDPLKNASKGFKDAGGGLSGISSAAGALLTGGLPLLITGFSSFVSVLSSYKPVADLVEQGTAGMKAGFAALVSGRDITVAASQAAELTAQLQDLDDAQADLIIRTAEVDASVRRLILSSKDRGKSEEEQLRLLKRASEIETQLFNDRREILEKKVETEEAAFRNLKGISFRELEVLLGNGKAYDDLNDEKIKIIREGVESRVALSDEELEKLRAGRVSIIKLEGDYYDLQEKLQNRSNAILEKGDAAREKQREKELADAKRRQDDLNRLREQYLKNLEALETQFLLDDRDRLEKSFNDKLATLTGQGERETVLRLTIEQEKQDALDRFDADLETKRQEKLAAKLVKDLADQNKAIAILESNRELQLELQRQFNQSQDSIDKEFAESNFETFKEFYAAKMQLYKDDTAAKKAEADEQKRIEAAQASAARGIVSVLSSISQAVGEQTAAGIAFQKAAAIAQLAINTATAISSAIAGAAEASEAGGPAAPFLLVGYIASMVGAVVGAVASASQILNSTDTPKYALGGDVEVGGRSHNEGGTIYRGTDGNVIEVERGEGMFVMKRNAYQDIHKLSAWNEGYGGNSWFGKSVKHAANGGYIADGGYAVRELSSTNDMGILIQNAIRQGFILAPPPVVSVQEIDSVRDSRNRSVVVSEG